MPSLHGVKVSIKVKQNSLPEYNTSRSPTSSHVTCYVESQTDQTFAISLSRLPTQKENLAVHLYCDGVRITKTSFRAVYPKLKIKDVCTGPNVARPLKFAAIKLVDDEELGNEPNTILEELGSIRVEIWRYQPSRDKYTPSYKDSVVDMSSKKFDEKSRKAQLAHTTGLGSERPAKRRMKAKGIIIGSKPLGTFEFVYRSRSLLEANNLIPVSTPVKGFGDMHMVSSSDLDRMSVEIC